MQRKVIQIANSTQLISLPRKWCLDLGIKKGAPLEVTEDGRRLIVSTDDSIKHKEIEIVTDGMDCDLLISTIRALYIKGYDEIKLKYGSEKLENIKRGDFERPFEVIENEVRNLSGVEIFDQRENYCIIKSISNETMKEFDTMLKRIFTLSSATISDLIEGYEKENKGLLRTIQNKHDSIAKFTSYCQRLLNKVNYNDMKNAELHYHILEVIDIIIDLIKHNANTLIHQNVKPSKKGIAVYKKILETFNMYFKLYYSYEHKKITAIIRNKYKVKALIKKYFREVEKNELGVLTNMARVFENILRLTISRLALEY